MTLREYIFKISSDDKRDSTPEFEDAIPTSSDQSRPHSVSSTSSSVTAPYRISRGRGQMLDSNRKKLKQQSLAQPKQPETITSSPPEGVFRNLSKIFNMKNKVYRL